MGKISTHLNSLAEGDREPGAAVAEGKPPLALHDPGGEQRVAFYWHEFTPASPAVWRGTVSDGGVAICLNLSGHGRLLAAGTCREYRPRTAGFFGSGTHALTGLRAGRERHQFVSVSFSAEYLRTRLANGAVPLHPCLSELIRSDAYHSFLGPVQPLNSRLHQIALNLREPPVCRAAREWWYEGKALELAAELLVAAPTDTDHVTRQGEVNRERAARVVQILKETLAQPPSLRELGRRVGCSHYHLSRIFSEVMGMTISQHLRQLRLERAAELLATRRCNVTEAALEVGYSSLSHFSQAFHEEYGCCPGLYPLATHTQRVSWKT